MARGVVIVGAVMAPGRAEGFPTALRDVIAVGAIEDAPAGGNVLSAPGRDILTLMPGGTYDFVSGSSMATAHVSGAVALLRSLDGQLAPAALRKLLQQGGAGGIDICRAMQGLTRGSTACGK